MTTRFPGHRAVLAIAALGLAAGCAPQPPLTDATRPAPAAETVLAPPPPAPPAAAPSAGLEELVVSGSRRTADAGAAMGAPRARGRGFASEDGVAPAPYVEPSPAAGPAPIIQRLEPETGPALVAHQSGQLTAGDHDDLLNGEAYEAYARRFLERYGRQGLPLVDAAGRLQVTVRGADGRPAPLALVEARTADGRSLTLATKADGRVVLFPALDQLGREVALSARAEDGARVATTVRLAADGGPQDVTLTLSSPAPRVRALDVVLVMDTTGSMGDELNYLTSELADILTGVGARSRGLDVRTGLVFYRDLGDEYTVRTYPFTGDPKAVQRTLAHQQAMGGGDMPEAMQLALREADAYPWRDDAVKVVLLVADAPPHGADMPAAWAAGLAARKRNIQIVPVAASGVDDDAQYLMRAMAAASQGRYVFITDDSGIGNPHAEPTVDCYLVTRLDDLISRVIGGLASGERIEPAPGDVVRRVGHYDRGVCRPRR